MSPEDKVMLVSCLKDLRGHPWVGMCGDGANDCAALKTADIGLCLGTTEASVAAPFTSNSQSIINCLDLLREGRGALVNAMQIFEFVCLYALIEFVTVTTLSWFGSNLTMSQYTYIDLVQVLPLSIAISLTSSADILSNRIPNSVLLSIPSLTSITGQLTIQMTFIIFTAWFIPRRSFYVPFIADDYTGMGRGSELECHINTAIFLVTCLQYPAVCLSILHNRPWRKDIYKNLPFCFWVVLLVLLFVGMLLCEEINHIPSAAYPSSLKSSSLLSSPSSSTVMACLGSVLIKLNNTIASHLNLVWVPVSLRVCIASMSIVNFTVSWVFESVVISRLMQAAEENRCTLHTVRLPLAPPSS